MNESSLLDAFPNPQPGRDYLVEHFAHEFTSLCPKTGQPDFGTIQLRYIPGPTCIELKSLKLYLHSFRDRGIFYEDVTNLILKDLADACAPKWMCVRTAWSVRGGIHSVITAQMGDEKLVAPFGDRAEPRVPALDAPCQA